MSFEPQKSFKGLDLHGKHSHTALTLQQRFTYQLQLKLTADVWSKSFVIENRKNAYRYLLYWAMVRIRMVEGSYYTRSYWSYLSPQFWRIGFQNVQYAGALADYLHNLAFFSSRNFDGFNEVWFWEGMDSLNIRFPDQAIDYRTLFEKLVAELESHDYHQKNN